MESNKDIKNESTVNNKRNIQNLNMLARNLRGGRNERIGDVPIAKKRVFVPNIPVRRDRLKVNSEEQKKYDKPKNDKNQRGKGADRGRRGRGRGEFIQTEGGIFVAGPSAPTIRREYGQRNTEGSGLQIPKFTPVSVKTKAEKEEEEERLKNFLKDDFIGDEFEYDDIKPVKLPLVTQIKCEEELKPDLMKIKIKKEPKEEEEEEMKSIDDIHMPKKEEIKKEEYAEDNEKTVDEIFTNNSIPESGTFVFFQFPKCPLKSYLVDDVKSKSSDTDNDANNDENDEVFKDIPEGLIGKLLILKSGKVILRLGSMSFNVENGTNIGFLQEVVSLKVNEESKDLHVLGYLNNRIVCLPDINSLVKNICI